MQTTELLTRITEAGESAKRLAASRFTDLAQEVHTADAARVLRMRFHECPDSGALLRNLEAYESLYLTVPAQKKGEAGGWIRWIRQCGWQRPSYGAYGARSLAKLEWVFEHPRWPSVRLYFALNFEGNNAPDACKLVGRKVMKEVTEFELVCPGDTASAISEDLSG